MPTVILLDISSPMSVRCDDDDEKQTKLQLAVKGLNTLLDFLVVYAKVEFVALVTFAGHCQVLSTFTREFDSLRSKMAQLRTQETPNLQPALVAVDNLVVGEWGTGTPCNVLLVTQEHIVIPRDLRVPFSFPGNLMVVLLSGSASPRAAMVYSTFESFQFEKKKIYQAQFPLCSPSVQCVFLNLSEDYYSSWIGQLMCGNLNSKVTLSPPPEPYTKLTDFDCLTYTVQHSLKICGFIEVKHLGSPAAVSRHLVLPCSTSGPNLSQTEDIGPPVTDEEIAQEVITPSFCVLLHGALKVENMAALCNVGQDWYGVLYSWTDSKKKTNLMLNLFEPGSDSVPWLGDLSNMNISTMPDSGEHFPVRPADKASYAQNYIVWIHQSALQSDIQKLLKHARKMPDKTQQYYKELNRIRRTAISLGFMSLIDSMADILERECTLLPGTAHPACAFQLTHSASILRDPSCCKDPKYTIVPMEMSF